MSTARDRWNPEDGPPPTEAEVSQARCIAERLEAPVGPVKPVKPEALPPELSCIVDTALRVRAAAHPSANTELAKSASARAVSEVLHARPRLLPRLRLAVAAAGLLLAGTGGLSLARMNHRAEHRPITHAATDVFTAAVEPGAGSGPTARIHDARLSAYRAALLGGRRR